MVVVVLLVVDDEWPDEESVVHLPVQLGADLSTASGDKYPGKETADAD